MASNKRKYIKLTSPIGVAKYPWLNEPDIKFNPDGEYRTSLLLDPNEAADFLSELDQLADEAVAKAKEDLEDKGKGALAKKVTRKEPYMMEADQETGEETGKVEVRFKLKALIKTKKGKELRFTPALFDAQGKPLNKDNLIYGGSEIRVNFTPMSYYVPSTKMAGVTLQINAVQVIKLVTNGGGDADSFGFGVVEGGYQQPNEEEPQEAFAADSVEEEDETDF